MRRLLIILIAFSIAVPASADFVYFKKKAAAGGGGTVDNFDGESVDNTTYIVQVENGATATQTGGELTFTETANSHNKLIAYRTAITKTTHTYKLDAKRTGTPFSGQYWMRVEEQADLPTLATWNDAKCLILTGPDGNGAASIYYKPPSDVDTLVDSAVNGTILIDTYYRVILETTDTQWRMRYVSVDEGTEYMNSGWITWANTRNNSTNLWLILDAEPYAGNYGSTVLTRFEIQ